MNIITVLAVAVALGTDAFSMAFGIGMGGIKTKRLLTISGVVSIFHVVMPLIGLTLGAVLGKALGQMATALGALVLLFIGLQMIWGSLKPERLALSFVAARREIPMLKAKSPHAAGDGSLWGIITLAGGVSLDALSVGFGLGTLQTNLLLTVSIFGLVAGLMTASGFLFGRHLGAWIGGRAKALGGLILVIIAIRLFLG
ncbi:MAG: manganese efflux pump MntP [Bacillota bacterium]